jgi:hypothetical protein
MRTPEGYMNRLSFLRLAFAAVAVALAAAAFAGRAQAQSGPGYLWLQSFSADATSSSLLTLSGTFTNDCTGGLPPKSYLEIRFDQAVLLDVPITAGFGSSQAFSSTASVPALPPPKNHVTGYLFTIVFSKKPSPLAMPGFGPDMKTSPCLVTGVLGTPS